jgi:hypothetical protein
VDSTHTTRVARAGERRRSTARVLLERRGGFDRRRVGGALGRFLVALRDSPAALLMLLVSINVMNLLDQLATSSALAAGFREGNPVMASLISADPRLAAMVKLLSVLAVSLGIWKLRRYRMILQVALFTFALFCATMLVHFYGHAFFY